MTDINDWTADFASKATAPADVNEKETSPIVDVAQGVGDVSSESPIETIDPVVKETTATAPVSPQPDTADQTTESGTTRSQNDYTTPTTPLQTPATTETETPRTGGIDKTPVAVPMYEQNYNPTMPIPQSDFSTAYTPSAFAPGAPADTEPRPKGQVWKFVTTGALSAVLSLALCFGAISTGVISVPVNGGLSTATTNTGGTGTTTGVSQSWSSVAKKVGSSVVSITVAEKNAVAQGSGAILDTKGNIVTNAHVVNGGNKIQVTLSNGNIYEATLVGMDATTDLAVIKLKNPPTELTAVSFADSDDVAVGQQIMSAGNPLGYSNSITSGIVSAVDRPVSVSDSSGSADQGIIVTNAIQIDSSINQGNSGGPTFDADGNVIGINSSIASTSSSTDTAGSIGIGFAIPSNLVKRVSNEIIKNGKVQHVKLGVTITTASATVNGVTRAGAKIAGVTSGSAGAKAGLRKGDVIVAYDGKSTDSNEALMGHIRAAALNDEAKLSVVRDGKLIIVNVKLDKVEDTSNVQPKTNNNDGSSDGLRDRIQDSDGSLDDLLNDLFNR